MQQNEKKRRENAPYFDLGVFTHFSELLAQVLTFKFPTEFSEWVVRVLTSCFILM